jgi:hypothetical protein
MAILMAGGRSAPGGLALLGRREECAVLDRLREGAWAGRSGVLVVQGEAGVGKTALLDYAIGSASDMRVVRASGVESEMELAFAVLHQVCAPLLDRRQRLHAPQRHALEITFGRSPSSWRRPPAPASAASQNRPDGDANVACHEMLGWKGCPRPLVLRHLRRSHSRVPST